MADTQSPRRNCSAAVASPCRKRIHCGTTAVLLVFSRALTASRSSYGNVSRQLVRTISKPAIGGRIHCNCAERWAVEAAGRRGR